MKLPLAAQGKKHFRIQLLDIRFAWASSNARLGWIWDLHSVGKKSEAEDFCINNEMAESQFYKSKMFSSQHNCSFFLLLESLHCAYYC